MWKWHEVDGLAETVRKHLTLCVVAKERALCERVVNVYACAISCSATVLRSGGLFLMSTVPSVFKLLPFLYCSFFPDVCCQDVRHLSPSFFLWWRQGFVKLPDSVGWPQSLLAFTPPCFLPACQASWQCSPTTPVPRLQKPRLQLLRACQPAQAFPLVGRTRCHTATLSLHAKFLSCFALSSFFLFFFLIFALCLFHGTFLCWQPFCIFILHSCPGFLPPLFFICSGWFSLTSFPAISSLTRHYVQTLSSSS